MSSVTRLAVASPSFTKSPELMAELESLGLPLTANMHGLDLAGSALIEFLGDAEIAIIGREPITADILKACPKLRCIVKYGVGLDNVDEALLKAHGVKLMTAPGTNRRAVAELVLAFALGHLRNVMPSVAAMREGRWIKDGGRNLSNATVGIVGFGNTGSEVATLLKAFGSEVLYTDIVDKRSIARSLGARQATFADMLARVDVLTFHVPGTPETEKMLGSAEIAQMQKHALVINTSRGSVVDFDAVCEAVAQGRLGGFAADVYAREPYDASALRHPRLYFTPHIGGNSREAVLAMGRGAIAGVRECLGAK